MKDTHIVVNTKSLRESLKFAGSIVPKGNKLQTPIHGNVVIGATNGLLSIMSTDRESFLTMYAHAETHTGPSFCIAVPWKDLNVLVSAAGKKDTELKLSVRYSTAADRFAANDKEASKLDTVFEVRFAGDAGCYPVETSPVADQLSIPELDPAGKPVGIFPAGDLHDAFYKVFPAVSDDDMRRSLSGVCFDGGRDNIVATDGHRLHIIKQDLSFVGADRKPLIPADAVKALMPMLKTSLEIQSTVYENHITFTGDNFRFVIKMIDAEFPDYTQVIPREHAFKTDMDPAAFADAVTRMKRISRGREDVRGGGFFVECTFNGALRIADTLRGGLEIVKTETAAEKEIVFGCNVDYLLDVAKLAGKRFTFSTGKDHKAPFRIDTGNLTSIIMPMERDKTKRA